MKKSDYIVALMILVIFVMTIVIMLEMNRPTYSDEQIDKMAYDYCKDYKGVRLAQENILRVSILCNQVAFKGFFWDTYHSTTIHKDVKIYQERLESKSIYGIWSILFLIIMFEILNKKEKEKQREKIKDEN